MKTYNKSDERLVKKVFRDVSDKYDLMNDLMSLGIHRIWKKKFMEYLNPQPNTKLIDVASGTGDIAKLFLEKVNYKGNVFCLDENKEMLELSKKKLKNLKNVNWLCGNAEKLPYKDNQFDYYTISFGIRNVENIEKALTESFRVLKPGGRFLCLEFSKIKSNVLNNFYKIYSKTIPQIGELIVGKSAPYKYLVESIENFYSQEQLLTKIKNSNFSNASFRNLNNGIAAIHSGWKI